MKNKWLKKKLKTMKKRTQNHVSQCGKRNNFFQANLELILSSKVIQTYFANIRTDFCGGYLSLSFSPLFQPLPDLPSATNRLQVKLNRTHCWPRSFTCRTTTPPPLSRSQFPIFSNHLIRRLTWLGSLFHSLCRTNEFDRHWRLSLSVSVIVSDWHCTHLARLTDCLSVWHYCEP